jgi:hypothetical protein
VLTGRRIYKYSIPFLGGDDIFAGWKEKEPEKGHKRRSLRTAAIKGNWGLHC